MSYNPDNHIHLAGLVSEDPRTIMFPSGKAVNLKLAVYKVARKQKLRYTNVFEIEVAGLREVAYAETLKKGDQVILEGEVKVRDHSWIIKANNIRRIDAHYFDDEINEERV